MLNIRTPSAFGLLIASGSLAGPGLADVVIQPTAVTAVSTWRSCVPQINVINGSGLSNAAAVTTTSPIPAAWPTHGTDGCNNMWHTSCPGQSGSTCEGGDTTPFIVFDLGGLYDITGFHLWNHNQVAPGGGSETNRGFRNVNVQVSADNVNYSSDVPFTNMAQGTGSTSYAGDDYALPATGVRYVKFTVLNNWGSATVTGLSEIRFQGTPQFGITGSAVTPGTLELCSQTPVLVTTRVVGLAAGETVTVAASGGPIIAAFIEMNDDGANGDAVAGDGVYSASVEVPAGYPQGSSTIRIGAEDSLGHTGFADITLTVGACIPTYNENGDAGETLDAAQTAVGSGPLGRIRGSITPGDADMFKVTVCDAAAFSATTVGGTTLDTQLFLFDAQGMGVQCNDDTPVGFPGSGTLQSTLSGAPAAGDYYLAVSQYDRDPVDATGAELFADTPFASQHTADGPGAANPIAGWNGAPAGTGNYAIALTGACFVSETAPCPADLGTAGGQPGSDGLLDNNDFIAFITYFFNADSHADTGIGGGLPGQDGLYDNNDFIAFINFFFAGCN